MGIMTFLRNRAGIIIVGAIGFAIVAFLLGDLLNYGGPILNRNQNEVGSIDGESIDYQTFNSQVDMAKANFQQQSGGTVSPQMSTYIVENIWNQQVSQILLSNEVEKIGLNVGKNELSDLVTGRNPSPQLAPYFTNPQTGEFDRNQLNVFLNNIKNEPANSEQRKQWEELLKVVKNGRLQQKYQTLVENSVYITSLEANAAFTDRNKLANFDYVLMDYATIPDAEITPTKSDYNNYFNEHKNVFRTDQAMRSFEYVIFEAIPTTADSAASKEGIKATFDEFKSSDNDSLFAAIKSDTKYPLIYRKEGTLPPLLDSAIFAGSKGEVVGPVFENGIYEIAKIIDTRMSPDSVQASHILLNPAIEGGVDKARAKADSLKQLIQNGASFADLAAQFGTDATKDQGGDLGTFARGNMIPEFEEAVFNGSQGDLLTISTQYGIHLVRIVRQIGSSRVVKAAIVDNVIKNSEETLQSAFSKASEFFGSVNSENFSQVAQNMGIEVQKADRVLPMQGQIGDIESPRELIQWAFEAEAGAISDKIIEIENKNIIARLTQIIPKGIPSLENIKEDIKPEVIKQLKATQLKEKINKARTDESDLVKLASALGTQVLSVDNVVFSNPIIPGVAQEATIIGTIFGMQPTNIEGPIKGQQGVYMLQLTDFINPETPKDLSVQKQQMSQSIAQRIASGVFQTLEAKADITDNRVKFY